MHSIRIRPRAACAAITLGLVLCADAGITVASPVRDLPDSYTPGTPFTVTITLNTPGGTGVVGAEDAPPPGWPVSNISNSGSFDTGTGKVKWGPFFSGSIPATLSYDITPNAASGAHCFDGAVSFDTDSQTIIGDACLEFGIPTVSEWGLVVLALCMAAAGAIGLRSAREREATAIRE